MHASQVAERYFTKTENVFVLAFAFCAIRDQDFDFSTNYQGEEMSSVKRAWQEAQGIILARLKQSSGEIDPNAVEIKKKYTGKEISPKEQRTLQIFEAAIAVDRLELKKLKTSPEEQDQLKRIDSSIKKSLQYFEELQGHVT